VIQAIALESLGSRIGELALPAGVRGIPLDAWLQALGMLFAILVLWIYYAQIVMRLSWVPELSDSLIPFALGITQFLEIHTLGCGGIALWLAPIPAMFLLCHFGWNRTVDRALAEAENAPFAPAFRAETRLVRDGPMLGSVALLGVLAAAVALRPGLGTAALVVLDLLLLAQIGLQGRYWRESMGPRRPS